MKAILKVIWFALAVMLIQKYSTSYISEASVGILSDKLSANLPSVLGNYNLKNFYNQTFVTQLIFAVILFLGLDIISGDIKGLIKGPIKLAFNTILYVIGFTVLFFFLNNFTITL